MTPASSGGGALRAAAILAVVTAAATAVALMLYIGRHNASRLVLVGFIFWILSPFVVLGWADRALLHWDARTRVTLWVLMLLISVGTIVAYAAVLLGPPRPKPAATFVAVPPVSWVLIALVLGTAARLSRRRG